MAAKHTPVPWGLNAGDETKIMAVQYHIASTQCVGMTGIRVAEAEANAEFIVRACNNHYDLLGALQEAVEWDSHDSEGVPAVWLEKARAAIAKARGAA